MEKIPLVERSSDTLTPGLVIAGSTIAGAVLLIPVLFLSSFRALTTATRAARRILTKAHPEHTGPQARHAEHYH